LLLLLLGGLDVLEELLEAGHAGFGLIEGVVEGLNLGGDLVELAGLGIALKLHLALEGVHVEAHAIDGVGGLLDEILEDAHALVVGLSKACNGVLELLDLGHELDHLLADGVGLGGEEG
jgi:hypothetical protein